MLHRETLSTGWKFTQVASPNLPVDKPEWVECDVPTSVQASLIKAGKIEHPYKDLKEWDIQWIAEANWRFQKTFAVTPERLSQPNTDLVFDGLDTYCDVILNGTRIGSTDNMFRSYRFPVKDYLKEGPNELILDFRAPLLEAKKEEAQEGGPKPLWNGDSSRLYSRKAQYGWGWDWGPIIMTIGPWQPVHLETYTARFEDIRIDTALSPVLNVGHLATAFEVSSGTAQVDMSEYQVKAILRPRGSKQIIKEQTLDLSGARQELNWTSEQGEVEAWWPVGYGSQPLYELQLMLLDKAGKELAAQTTRVAFRTVKVVQEPLVDAPGTSFLFEVNGVRIFCGGSNWIPGDNFFTEIKPERYRKWIELLVNGNQNMLRIWAGGIFEDEALYDACDELGVLVWQDFMFGCGLYPSYDTLNKSIKIEAEQAVRRLRNHPSVVIFAGNNEDYAVAEEQGVIDYSDESGDYLNSKFPARHIYEILLPEVVGRLSTIHYHRGSPYGGAKTCQDLTVGDVHQWDVWHGAQEPWSNWDKLAGRFVSEFGMEGYPDRRTVDEWSDDKAQLFPQSRVSVQHNKARGFERRLELYLVENFRHAFDMPSYIFATQIMQAECIGAAYRLWRRNWKGRGKEYTAGALVWQLNDCWPCVSWSIADYYLRPKPAYFAIKRELEPYTVGLTRKEVKEFKQDNTTALFEIHHKLELWGCNSTLKPKKAKFELVSFHLDAGEVDRQHFDVILAPNASTEIWSGQVPGQPILTSQAEVPKPIVVQARLLGEKGEVLARYSNWPEPYKYLIFPDPSLEIKWGDAASGTGKATLTLSCKKPVKGIVLDVKEGEVEWSDQGIDLFPGDDQVISVSGAGVHGSVTVRYVGDEGESREYK